PAPNATARLAGLGLVPFRPPANAAPPPAEAIPYLPPERLTTGPSEPLGDLYGLGATLYYLLTGRPPYSGATPEDTLRRLRTGEPAALVALRPDAPPELVELVNRLMARRPESRPAGAADVEVALGKFCRPGTAPQGSPEEAEPVPQALPADMEQSLVMEEVES